MNFTPEQLARLAQTPHMDLMLQRGRARQANDNALDQQLAPYEHQAFAREYVGQHPISGALAVVLVLVRRVALAVLVQKRKAPLVASAQKP